jgi:formylglycine-generating enzyme required for sulfatase activity
MKTKLGLLLLMLLIAVGCDDSTHLGQTAEQPQPEQPEPEQPEPEQPDPVPADLPVIELPSFTNTLDMTFKEIPAGTFTMGSPEGEEDREDDETQHKVTITKAFYMQTTEVTQGQWKEVMGTEPWKGKQYVKEGPDYPPVYVSWDDAVAYCKKLSEKEGKTYRLPTEAEWEYACRAGTQTAWSFGDDEKELGDYAWYDENADDIGEEYAHQVELKKANSFGLYDMHGNVCEWCLDDATVARNGSNGPGARRVLRGGSWLNSGTYTRSAFRKSVDSDARTNQYGFRVVLELD